MYQKIKILCEDNNISVYYLEKQLGFSTGSICKWDISMPRADALFKLANYFKKPIDYFISSSNIGEN